MRQKGGVPGPPPVILVPDTGVAQAAYAETLLPGSAPQVAVTVSWRIKTEMTEFRTWVSSGPKCFQVLGLSPSLLQNPMLWIGGPQ